MTLVKICGVTLADDAAACVAAGADFVGLNFWPKSKRHVDVDRAALLAGVARGAAEAGGRAVKIVGVFVEPSLAEVERAVATVGFDIIQLHGDHESPVFVNDLAHATNLPVWRAFSLAEVGDLDRLEQFHTEARVEAILVDAPAATQRHAAGGDRRVIDFALVAQARARLAEAKLVMAGGLDAGNVAAAIAAARPWCVDVASGVESAPGIKDAAKVAAFIAAAVGSAP